MAALIWPAMASTRWQRDGQHGNNCSRRMCQRIDHLSWQHHSYSQSWHCQIQPIRPSWKCLPKVTPPIRVLIMLLKDENTTDSVRIFFLSLPLVLNIKFKMSKALKSITIKHIPDLWILTEVHYNQQEKKKHRKFRLKKDRRSNIFFLIFF